MSRLRYNGLATGASTATVTLALGAALTNAATSVTFNAALTYNNGTAVPTITGTDYIPLSILDTNGNLSEIVYLTAYTAAATTGTITRGQEGTTGIAHASGDKIVGAPTTTDFASNLKPGALHATYGDDFTGTSLDGKWTRVGYIAGDEQYAQGAAATYLQIDTGRTTNNYYYQTAPVGDWTLVMRVVYYGQQIGNTMFGLLALDGSGNGGAGVIYTGAPFTVMTASVAAGAYNSSFTSGKGSLERVFPAGIPFYIALNRVGTAYRSRFSPNGEIWAPWTPTLTVATTVTRIGFGCIFGTPDAFAVDFFDVQ